MVTQLPPPLRRSPGALPLHRSGENSGQKPKPEWVPSLRSPSGKRMYPRVSPPAEVEIEGHVYAIRDLSLGGFALDEAGPEAEHAAPFRVVLHVGQRDVRLMLEVTAQVSRVQDGRAVAFQFIALPAETANALDRVVESWLVGSRSAADAMPEVRVPAARAPRLDRRFLRAAALLAVGGVVLLAGAASLISSRLVVYSEFGAVAAPLRLVRAPQPGLLTLNQASLGAPVREGQVLAELQPNLPPQFVAELESRIQVLDGRVRALEGEMAGAAGAFAAFRRQAEAELRAAAENRALLERQVAAQARLFERLRGLSRQGIISAARSDQEEINLITSRRALAEAVAAESAARNLLAEAEAGRFRPDGRPVARGPDEIVRELERTQVTLADARATRERVSAPLSLTSPCDCTIAQLGVTSGTLVTAGEAVFGLAQSTQAGARREGHLEVDALVATGRMGLLQAGQEVRVRLAGAEQPLIGTITALNFNPENTGRVGLPDNLRTLRSYGLVTVVVPVPAASARVGLPTLLEAPVSVRMLLLNLPLLGWLAR